MRCSWAESDALRAYHDDEWGRPVTDERGLFEKLCLEAFQSGLSWSTILRKRDGFRRAFAGFDPGTVAALGPNDVDRLLADPEIVRNRAKIEAVIANARAVVALRGEPLAFAGLVARRSARGDAGVEGAREGAQGPGLPLRRPDDRLRAHAGVRARERSRRHLLRAGHGQRRAGRGAHEDERAGAVDFGRWPSSGRCA